jgi:fused signal recognition particle receptor
MDLWTPELVGTIAAIALGGALWLWRLRRGRAAGGREEPAAPPEGGVPRTPERGIRAALASTGRRFRERVEAAMGAGAPNEVLEALEEALLAADVGVRTTARILERLRAASGTVPDASALRLALRDALVALLDASGPVPATSRPWVVLVTGVNGVGKTTTIGKLASLHASAGRKVLVVAGDTFRAAAIDQLAVWADRAGADLVRHEQGADPSAVIYDGLRAAQARAADVVLIDTAGRLHTRTPLMDELRKVRRTVEREIPGAPHEVLLVLDATTGQNAITQARSFVDAAGVTGVVVTKLDGTAKGGVVVAVGAELGIPVRYVGVGEAAHDLKPFDREEFVGGLLGMG